MQTFTIVFHIQLCSSVRTLLMLRCNSISKTPKGKSEAHADPQPYFQHIGSETEGNNGIPFTNKKNPINNE
ncbi:hypothetical protein KP509_25G074100 [Ceratopteris richardii]|uniref:Uncharacterized protein n=1 Tax=Ceratopteris richardii TaxID=49495 RepID=A0A8T2RRS6_CERRI|nr:hypothetical protein KP509_25G074100 [Ceratopteris richardii]